MIDIKDIQGNIILSVPVTESAQKVEELMSNDYIQLSWNSDSSNSLPLGSYIEHEGERYSLIEPYTPSQKNEVEFVYTPQFKSRVMAWGKKPFFFYSSESKEPDWTLTSNPADFMRCVCDAIVEETGESWSYSIDASLPASASLSFTSVDILSGLNQIAGAFETEWFADKSTNTIYLGLLSHGKEVTLEVGKNINVPSVQGSKEGYYTRFYAFGSTRNITQDYEGTNTNNLVNKRLTLDPAKYPNGYKNIREGLSEGEIFSKVLIFDEVYPSANLNISGVRNRLMYRLDTNGDKIQVGTDEEGNPIYDQYAIWYFRIEGFDFDISNIIEGYNLSVSFQSGALQGREFELKYYEKDTTITTSDGLKFEAKAGDYEILFIEEGSYIIPSMTGLVPSDGDRAILFNIKMPSEYTQSAYAELEDRLDKEIARMSSDLNNYTFKSNPVAFNDNNPNLSIGRSVRFVNGNYSYNTRVIKLTTHLDFPIEQEITIGNEKVKGNTQQLKEEVASANKDLNLLAVFNDMTQSIQQSYNRTQQMMLEGFAAIKNIWQLKETESGEKYAWSAFNVVTQQGITMYADNGTLDLPSIYAGLRVDNSSIYWEDIKDEEGNVIDRVLKAKIGTGEGGSATLLGNLENVGAWANALAEEDRIMVQKKGASSWTSLLLSEIQGTASFENVKESGEGNAYTSIELSEDKKTLTLNKGENFAKQTDYETLNAKVTDFFEGSDTDNIINKWKELEAFLDGMSESSDLADILSDKADKATTLSGYGITDAYTKIEADNLLAKKWTQDDTKISNWDTAFGWGDHSKQGYTTKTYVDGKFLPLVGGTITGDLRLRTGSEYTSPYLYFGDSDEVYLKEATNQYLTIHSDKGIVLDSPLTTIDGIEIKKSADGVLYIDANLVVSGGITMYGTDGTTSSSIWDGAPIASTSVKGIASFDSEFFAVNNGKVTFIGETGGGASSWDDLEGKPSWIGSTKPSYTFSEIGSKPTTLSGYGITDAKISNGVITLGSSTITPLTQEKGDARYLKLTGGTIEGTLQIKRSASVIKYLDAEGESYGWLGFNAVDTPVMYTSTANRSIKLLHAENYNTYAPKLDGTGAKGVWDIDISGEASKVKCTAGTADTYRPVVVTVPDAATQNLYYGEKVLANYATGDLKVSSTTVDGIRIYKSSTGVLRIDGDVVLSGALTMYGTDSVNTSTIMDGVVVDGTTIMNDGKKLYLNPNLELGGIDEDELNSYLTSNKYLTQTTGDTRYVTALGIDGNNLTWTKNGVVNNITVPYATTAKELTSYSAITFSKSDNSGKPCYLLIADVTSWYNVSSGATNYGVAGFVYGYRNGASPAYSMNIAARCAYGKGYYSLNSSLKSIIEPRVVSYNSKYYLALYLQGSNRTFNFIGRKDNLLSSFTELQCSDGNGTYSGLSAIYKGSATGTSSKADSLSTSRTISITGHATGSGSFDGSSDLGINIAIPTRNVYINGTGYTVHSTITTDTTGVYAPTSGGTSGYVLKANGVTSIPIWVAQSSLSVGTASKLSTERTIWGQSFDGTASVSGNMTGVGSITMSGALSGATTGTFSSTLSGNEVVITNSGGTTSGHLRFSRASANYIAIPTGGTLAVNLDGSINAAGSDLIVRDGAVHPGTSGSTSLGRDGNLWNGLYLYGGSTSSAFNKFGINFGADVARISANSSGGLGIYAIGDLSKIYLRAGCTTTGASSTGLVVDADGNVEITGNLLVQGGITMYGTGENTSGITSDLIPETTATYNLGNEDGRWLGVYSNTGNFSGAITMSGTTGSDCSISFTRTHSYIMFNTSINFASGTATGADTIMRISSNGYVGINTYQPTVALDVVGSIKASGTVTQGSDIRYKDIHKDILLSLATMAEAPSIEFHFKDDEQKSTHIGTSAQYWQSVSGVVTEDSEGRLGMDYSSLGVVMGISLAKELSRFESDTDRRIRLLEEENKRLKEEIEQLKTA